MSREVVWFLALYRASRVEVRFVSLSRLEREHAKIILLLHYRLDNDEFLPNQRNQKVSWEGSFVRRRIVLSLSMGE